MTKQETADKLALLAKPRITNLLRLQSVQHIHDATPGKLMDTSTCNGMTIVANRLKEALEPYKDLSRFTTEERIMSRVIDIGLLPIVTAMMQEIRSKKFLLTRNIANAKTDHRAYAHIEGIGVRVSVYMDLRSGDTIVAWHCLYGTA